MKNSRKPLNVLYLRDTTHVCGPGKTIINTCRTINRDLINLIVASTNDKTTEQNDFIKKIKQNRIRHYALTIGSIINLKSVLEVLRIIRKEKIDIIQTHDSQTRRIGAIAAKLTHVVHVSSVHGWIQNTLKEKLASKLDAFIIKRSDYVIVMSNIMKSQMEKIGADKTRIEIIYNSILLNDYIVENNTEEIRKKYNLDKEKVVIATIGRLSPEKGQEVFIEVAKRLLQTVRNVKFLIIGNGALENLIHTKIKEAALEEKILCMGYVADLRELYQVIDILIISSYTEGMPNVLLEAFAYKKPVVSSNVGGVSEILAHAENGYLVKVGDIASFEKCIKNLIENESLRKEMGDKGRRTIEQKCDFSKRTRRIEELYLELMK